MDSMYAYIKGELAEKNIDSIVVEAAGCRLSHLHTDAVF